MGSEAACSELLARPPSALAALEYVWVALAAPLVAVALSAVFWESQLLLLALFWMVAAAVALSVWVMMVAAPWDCCECCSAC